MPCRCLSHKRSGVDCLYSSGAHLIGFIDTKHPSGTSRFLCRALSYAPMTASHNVPARQDFVLLTKIATCNVKLSLKLGADLSIHANASSTFDTNRYDTTSLFRIELAVAEGSKPPDLPFRSPPSIFPDPGAWEANERCRKGSAAEVTHIPIASLLRSLAKPNCDTSPHDRRLRVCRPKFTVRRHAHYELRRCCAHVMTSKGMVLR